MEYSFILVAASAGRFHEYGLLKCGYELMLMTLLILLDYTSLQDSFLSNPLSNETCAKLCKSYELSYLVTIPSVVQAYIKLYSN